MVPVRGYFFAHWPILVLGAASSYITRQKLILLCCHGQIIPRAWLLRNFFVTALLEIIAVVVQSHLKGFIQWVPIQDHLLLVRVTMQIEGLICRAILTLQTASSRLNV